MLGGEAGLDHVRGVGEDGGRDAPAAPGDQSVERRQASLVVHHPQLELVESGELHRRVGEETDAGYPVTYRQTYI